VSPTRTHPMTDSRGEGPVLFAYDGSEQAKAAILQAGRQLQNGRPAIVLTVWEPFAAVPFAGAAGAAARDLEQGFETQARRVANEGVELARRVGFEARPSAEQGDPLWKRIVDSADEHDASIIVMGSHGRTGLSLVLLGSVAEATVRHTARPVLIAQGETTPADGRSG
jgi:nucleotide-binding universal stress UspA family protein